MPDARSASPAMVLNFTLIVPLVKLSTPLQHRDREVRELLRVVHQLFVDGAVQLARAFDQQLGRVVLAGDPRPAVDHDHLVGAVLRDQPGADHRLERRRRPADRLLAEIDLESAARSAATASSSDGNADRQSCNLQFAIRTVFMRVSFESKKCADHDQRRPDADRTPPPRPSAATASGCPRNDRRRRSRPAA